jgi:hypothetical protein
MTEDGWLACTEPHGLLHLLRGKRKSRLFAAACCRRLFPLLPNWPARGIVEAAERFADGQIGRRRLRAIWSDYFQQVVPRVGPEGHANVALVNLMLNYCLIHRPKRTLMDAAAKAMSASGGPWWDFRQRGKAKAAERAAQCDLLRDLTGNPFRDNVLEPGWLMWGGGTVVRLAEAIYAERRFRDMPELADALEEAGCADQDILRHCREQGAVHARGCWLLDLLLDKT